MLIGIPISKYLEALLMEHWIAYPGMFRYPYIQILFQDQINSPQNGSRGYPEMLQC